MHSSVLVSKLDDVREVADPTGSTPAYLDLRLIRC